MSLHAAPWPAPGFEPFVEKLAELQHAAEALRAEIAENDSWASRRRAQCRLEMVYRAAVEVRSLIQTTDEPAAFALTPRPGAPS